MAVTNSDEFKIKITTDSKELIDKLQKLEVSLDALVFPYKTLIRAVDLFTTAISVSVVAVASFKFATANMSNDKSVAKYFVGMADSAKAAGAALSEFAKKPLVMMMPKGSTTFDTITNGAKAAAKDIQRIFSAAWDVVTSSTKYSFDGLMVIISGSGKMMQSAFKSVFVDGISGSLKFVANGFSVVSLAVSHLFSSFSAAPSTVSHLMKITSSVVNLQTAFNLIRTVTSKTFSAIGSSAASVYQDFKKLNGIFGTVYNGFKSLSAAFSKFGLMLPEILSLSGLFGARLLGLDVIAYGLGVAVSSLGEKLFTAFDSSLPAAQEANDSYIKLSRTLKSLEKISEDTDTLSFSEWSEKIDELRESSVLSRGELLKLAAEVSRLGATYNLSGDDQKETLSLMSDMTKGGIELSEVTRAVTSALGGYGVEIEKLGFNLTEQTLNQSEYAREIGKTTVQMTANEKAAASISVMMATRKTLIEGAVEGQLTYAETLKRLAGLQKDFDTQLGTTGVSFQRKMAEAQIFMHETLAAIPPTLINAMTNTSTYSGALLLGVGAITKYSVALIALVQGYKVLQTLMMNNSAVQGGVTSFFSVLNKSLGGTFVHVHNLTDVFKNLGLSFVAIYAQAGGMLINGLKMIGNGVSALTMQLLRNPLFATSLGLVLAVTIVYEVLTRFRSEIKALLEIFPTWLKVLGSVVFVLASLTSALKASTVAQGLFMASTRILVVLMGGSAAGIVSVGTAFAALRVAMVGLFTTTIPNLIASFWSLIGVLTRLSLSVLSNPIVIAAVGIFGALALIVTAIKELREEVPIIGSSLASVSDGMTSVASSINKNIDIFDALKTTGLNLFKILVEGTKFALVGLLNFGAVILRTYFNVRSVIAGEDSTSPGKWNAKLAELSDIQGALAKQTTKSGDKIAQLTGSIADASEAAKSAAKSFNSLYTEQKNIEAISNSLASVTDAQASSIEILGDEYDKAAYKIEEAKRSYQEAVRDFDVDSVGAADDLKAVTTSYEEFIKAGFESEKLMRDNLKKMGEQTKTLRIEEMKRSGDTIGAIRAEAAVRLEAFNAQVAQARKLGTLGPEQEKVVNEAGKALSVSAATAESAEIERKKAESLQLQLKMREKLSELDKTVDVAALSQLKRSGRIEASAEKEAEIRTNAFKLQVDQLRNLGRLTIEQEAHVKEATSALAEENAAAIYEARLQQFGKIAELTGDYELTNAISLRKQLDDLENYYKAGLIEYEDFLKNKEALEQSRDHKNILDKAASDQKPMANITEEMSVGVAMPMLAAADKIADAVQGLLDFVPNLLNKVAHIFDTLRDLPIKLAEGIANVFSSVLSFFSNISQNFAKAFDKLFDGLTNFIDKLPDAMGNMIKNVPAIFNHIMQKIPALLGAIMKSAITGMPVLAMSFMMALVQGVPSFVHAFIDAVTKGLPKAFKESLEAAFTELAGMFHELMGGAKFKLPDISKQIAHVTNAIKGSASQLFNIQDFKTAAKGVDIGDKIAAAIRHSMFDLARMMGELWRFLVTALKAAWQWVYDKIIAPIWELVTGAWRWVYDTILLPIITALRSLWQTAWELMTSVINLLSDGFRAVVSWLVGAFTAVWDGLRQAASLVGATLVDAWRGFEHLVNVLASVFTDAAHLFDPIVNFRFPEFHWPALPELTIQKPSWWNLSTGGPVGGFGGVVSNTVSKAVGYVSSRAHFEGGGVVRGGVLYASGGTEVMGTDTVPAMLTPGEFVINRHAASRVGMPNLERLNSGQGLGGGGLTVNAPITINTTQSVDASFIRQTLVPTLLEAIKSATENGRYVINQKGIRA